jgi:hypothetical protein
LGGSVQIEKGVVFIQVAFDFFKFHFYWDLSDDLPDGSYEISMLRLG